MAERVPPPADHEHENDTLDREPNGIYNGENEKYFSQFSKSETTTTNSNCFGRVHATYVVQVPKDQIYRVPPAENAAIAERRRNPTKNDNKKIRPCTSRCCCILLFATVIVLALGLSASVLSALFKPRNPNFYVERVDVAFNNTLHDPHHSRDSRACNVTLRSENTNAKVDVSYREGGVVSLWFREREIGVGEFPEFYNARANSTVFDVALRGRNADVVVDRLRKEKEKKKQKANVKLSLKMENITARTDQVWTWITGIVKLVVACDVTVDSLAASGSRVLSQECRTTSEV